MPKPIMPRVVAAPDGNTRRALVVPTEEVKGAEKVQSYLGRAAEIGLMMRESSMFGMKKRNMVFR